MDVIKVRNKWGCDVTYGGNRERGSIQDTFKDKNRDTYKCVCLSIWSGHAIRERTGLFGFPSSEALCGWSSAFAHEKTPPLAPTLRVQTSWSIFCLTPSHLHPL